MKSDARAFMVFPSVPLLLFVAGLAPMSCFHLASTAFYFPRSVTYHLPHRFAAPGAMELFSDEKVVNVSAVGEILVASELYRE